MLGCSSASSPPTTLTAAVAPPTARVTSCPNCNHEFVVAATPSTRQPLSPWQPATPSSFLMAPNCCRARRQLRALSGGGLVALTPPNGGNMSPQISPSAQLSFVMPMPPLLTAAAAGQGQTSIFGHAPLPLVPPHFLLDAGPPKTELPKLSDTVKVLRRSGWYYEGLSFEKSHELLKGTAVGTFLVRNSSDPRFFFSLSVQTEKGPTSVRLQYSGGYFRLDAQSHLLPAMPVFPGVVELVEYYVLHLQAIKAALSKQSSDTMQKKLCEMILGNKQVWVDSNGKWYSSIRIERPLLKKDSPPSLLHLSRLAIHRTIQASSRSRTPVDALRLCQRQAGLPAYSKLELPSSLIEYLGEYPYSV